MNSDTSAELNKNNEKAITASRPIKSLTSALSETAGTGPKTMRTVMVDKKTATPALTTFIRMVFFRIVPPWRRYVNDVKPASSKASMKAIELPYHR